MIGVTATHTEDYPFSDLDFLEEILFDDPYSDGWYTTDLPLEEVIERLEELKRKHPGAFEVIEGTYTEPQPVEDAQLIDVSPDED